MILTNADIVLPDRVLRGTLVVRHGQIDEVAEGRSHVAGAIDCDGDAVIPGVIDLHTDNLERQVQPRSAARWPSRQAMLAHDAQCAVAGVTTVMDALCLGDLGFDRDRIRTFEDGVADLDALGGSGLLRAEHFLHLRCEVPAADTLAMLDPVAEHPRVRVISLMDHSPGFGQYADLEHYRRLRRREGTDAASIEERIVSLQANRARNRDRNRAALLARVRGTGAVLASHDDRTPEEIAENHADGIRISEFPVTMTAAEAAHARGMTVIAGAPNLVRGGSHSGNVAAAEILDAGRLDAFASDYVPASMVDAAFLAHARGLPLPRAIALVAEVPAAIAGLADRGRIAEGLRADLVRVARGDGFATARAVWREGERIG